MYEKTTPAWQSLLTLLIVALACMGGFVFTVDEVCRSNIALRQPLYPDAEIIQTTYDLFRPRAMGETRMTLRSADDEETVREWFRQLTLELLRTEQFRGIATVDYSVRPAEDGERVRLGGRAVLYLEGRISTGQPG